jgi:hypothetical protein
MEMIRAVAGLTLVMVIIHNYSHKLVKACGLKLIKPVTMIPLLYVAKTCNQATTVKNFPTSPEIS